MTDEINVTFIIPKECCSENDCSEEMKVAFSACEQHSDGGLKAKWVHENNYNKFDGLTKRDVFVLSDFDGEIYEKLKNTKCLLVGPRCLSCSLIEGTPIPRGPEPVFTIAMRGLVVTASGFTKTKKENIREKVYWMGGLYSTVLTDETTHLVSDTVISEKYIKSVEKGIPVMKESWIEAVWVASLEMNVNGSSSDFDVYHLPPFTNLQVTTSGITKKEKQMIMKLVNENGGVFSGAFQSETTDVVVLTKDGVGSEKYKAALEYGKSCVLPTWVKDSAKKGVALPFAKYKVVGASTSSPFAEHRLPDMSLNFSRITNIRAPSNFVDESRSVDMSTLSAKMKLTQESKKTNETLAIDKDIMTEFEKFDISCVRRAGPIFDGFCIWVSGLEGIARDRAAACVSRCGGVRYDGANERVTHAVAGTVAAAASAARLLPEVPVLNAVWLLRSAEAGRALPENDFLMEIKLATPVKQSSHMNHIEPASPMSKRNLQLLRHAPLDLPPPAPAPELRELPEPQDDLVNHYLSQNIPEPVREKTPELVAPNATAGLEQPEITDDMCEEPTEEIEQIFRDIKLEVQGLDEDAVCELGAEVSAAGGVLVAAGAGGVYALVPLDFDSNELITPTAQPVTVFWVKDCLSQQELLPVQYYHQPVHVPQWDDEHAPLQGVVASLSTYSGVERAFLDELAKLLGATTQLRFCRRSTANALASTHLICPSACGDKYAGAIKWRLPAVRASWLLACAAAGRRVSEKQHLVGDSVAPPTPEQSPTKEQEDAEELIPNRTAFCMDKENTMLPPQRGEAQRRASFPSKQETPKAKVNDGEDMSPASRYIAMARQGLLGGDSQETPKRLQELKDEALPGEAVRTPPLEEALSSPNLAALSPTTRRRLLAVRRGEMPSDPIRTPVDPFEKNPETPDSAFGAALRPGTGRLSPDSRKRLWRVVNDLPAKDQHQPAKEQHTPLSEIRNRFLAQFNSDAPTPSSEHAVAPRKLHLQDQPETPPPAKMAKLSFDQTVGSTNTVETDAAAKTDSSASSASKSIPAAVDAQLQRLSAALSNRLSSQRAKRSRESISVSSAAGPESQPEPLSQPNTVGWDDTSPPPAPAEQTPPQIKRFMLSSNVDNREEITSMIVHLGGEVCEGTELDATATHLLCAAPGRSEKMLGSVAGGRWVLHPAYIARSRQHGRFLEEEEFEWGNPRASCLPPLSGAEGALARAAHRWRATRARGLPGPFADVVALLHIAPTRRRLFARLVHAGGGLAPEDEPPYNNEEVTVCFADVKRYPLSSRDAAWLVSRRVPVCPPVLLSAYLTDETRPDPAQHCLPEFRPK